MEKIIKRRFGALAILGMFVALFFLPGVIADAPTENNVPGSYIFDIDYNDDDPAAIFAVKHEDSAELFRIQENGRVGIGTTNPGAKLDVNPSITSTADYIGIRSGMNYQGSSYMTNWYGMYVDSPTNNWHITNKYALVTGSGAGNVGFGTTSPTARVHIVTQSYSWVPFKVENDPSDKTYFIIEGYGDVGIGTGSPGAKLDVCTEHDRDDGAASIGYSCSATGMNAIAMGYDTTANEIASTAMGWMTTAGDYSTAMGYHSIADGGSTAIGWYSTASDNSIAIGYDTTATYASNAFGVHTTASGQGSTAMGLSMTTSGLYSFGIGLDSIYPSSYTITQDNTMAIMGGKVGIGTVSPNNELTVQGDADFTGKVGIGTTSPSTTLQVDGDVAFELDDTPLTISDPDDAVTVTHSYHLIAANSGYTDDLDTINGGDVAGQILIITSASGDTITVQNGEDNIILAGNDFELDDDDVLVLIYNGANWLEISRSDNY